jgi:predicted RNase H-like HicB family nuclease
MRRNTAATNCALWPCAQFPAELSVIDMNKLRKRGCIMKNEYTAVIKHEDDWWVGWIEEVPGVNCQGKSYDELKETLVITLTEALEFIRQDALSAASSRYQEEKIAV